MLAACAETRVYRSLSCYAQHILIASRFDHGNHENSLFVKYWSTGVCHCKVAHAKKTNNFEILLTPFFIYLKNSVKKMSQYDWMITLFRRQYVDQTNPSLGFTETDYFIDDKVLQPDGSYFSGFFKKVGKEYFALDHDGTSVVETDLQCREWKLTQRNVVDYMAVGIDEPTRSLKPINLEHAHIFLQFKMKATFSKVHPWLVKELGHKKFKLIACKGTSIEANDYCRAIGKYGGVENEIRKNIDGLPSAGGFNGTMQEHEPEINRQGKHDEAVAEIHQYITDHALDSSLDMYADILLSLIKYTKKF